MTQHLFSVLAGSAICLGLLVVIVLALVDLTAPQLGRLYLERANIGFEWDELTTTERRVYAAGLLLCGRLGRLVGPGRLLALLGARRIRGVRATHRGSRRRLVLAYATTGPTTGAGQGKKSIEIFVEAPSTSTATSVPATPPNTRIYDPGFHFGVRHQRSYGGGEGTVIRFYDEAELALLDYYRVAACVTTRRAPNPHRRA